MASWVQFQDSPFDNRGHLQWDERLLQRDELRLRLGRRMPAVRQMLAGGSHRPPAVG
ncbi:MAG: hypothetical protein ABR923_18620 [Terracidiphilus sp.]